MRWLVGVMVAAGLVGAAPAQAGIGSLLRAAVKAGSKAGSAGAKTAAKAGAKAGATGAKAGATAAKGAAGLGAVALAGDVFRYADDAADVGLYVTRSSDGVVSGVVRHGDELAEVRGPVSGLVDEAASIGDEFDVYVDESLLGQLDEVQHADARLFLASADGPSVRLRQAADGAAELEVVDDVWIEVGQGLAELSLEVALDVASSLPEGGRPGIQVVDPDCTGPQMAPSVEAAVERAEAGDVVWVVVAGEPPEASAVEALAQEADVDLLVVGQPDVCVAGGAPDVAALTAAGDHAAVWRAYGAGASVVAEGREGGEVVVKGASMVGTHGYADPEPPLWATLTALCLCFGCPLGVGILVVGGVLQWFRSAQRD